MSSTLQPTPPFDAQPIVMTAFNTEAIYRTTEESKQRVVTAFQGANIKKIGVIGYKSQGPAQAKNLRHSLRGTEITVSVGLREDSPTREAARTDGFREENDALGDVSDVVSQSDLVILLVEDAAQTYIYEDIFTAMKPGATLGFSHGFLLGHLQSIGKTWPRNDVNIIGVFPKGMGPSVRQLYKQGSGINCSYAVEQDATGYAKTIALAWAVGLHAPSIFETTLEMEYRSDIFGERGVLLGGVHGLLEALYRYHQLFDVSDEQAFFDTVTAVTGKISRLISEGGLIAPYQRTLLNDQGLVFARFYNISYNASLPILKEIYDEVQSGNEIRSVVAAERRKAKILPDKINQTPMWRSVPRDELSHGNQRFAMISGAYIGMMMAQIDVLENNGHSPSEICNESIIEAVDSLNPYMAARGVDYMVDNCSVTARRGAKKWKPRFEDALWVACTASGQGMDVFPLFADHWVHYSLRECLKLRPPISIAVE